MKHTENPEPAEDEDVGLLLSSFKLATFNSCCHIVSVSISENIARHRSSLGENNQERERETRRAPTIHWTMEPLINTSFSRFSDLLLEAEINFLQHVALFAEGCFCPRHVGPLIPNAKHTKYIQYNNQTISSLFRILACKK